MWDVEWKAISRRLNSWCATTEVYLRHIKAGQLSTDGMQRAAATTLGHEAFEIFESIDRLQLPSDLQQKLDEVKRRLGPLMGAMENSEWSFLISNRWVVLVALRSPLDDALAATEEPRRRLVDRAFLHLKRTLTVDHDARQRWSNAFSETRAEERCEKLGALHLLSHGIYSFKADAGSGRTDLILGTPLAVTDDVQSAEALVLTEWKLVRNGDDPAFKAREGKAQADRYSSVELAGIELQRHRYVVLVSMNAVPVPGSEQHLNVTTHYVNVVINPLSPSEHSRQIARNS
ncbi:MAG TPA: hypothetical protein VNO30_11425 [Kofleriaceae bacterium]|nr:hypothetical protein [Kofleriaceae bacterium]